MLIATRMLHILNGTKRQALEVRIHAPEHAGRSWKCRYEIDWPSGARSSAGHGMDAVQALTLAMHRIAADLYASPYHRDGKLMFEAPGSGYGFPAIGSLRDQLVGQDALADGS